MMLIAGCAVTVVYDGHEIGPSDALTNQQCTPTTLGLHPLTHAILSLT